MGDGFRWIAGDGFGRVADERERVGEVAFRDGCGVGDDEFLAVLALKPRRADSPELREFLGDLVATGVAFDVGQPAAVFRVGPARRVVSLDGECNGDEGKDGDEMFDQNSAFETGETVCGFGFPSGQSVVALRWKSGSSAQLGLECAGWMKNGRPKS